MPSSTSISLGTSPPSSLLSPQGWSHRLVCSPAANEAFRILKGRFTSAPLLKHPDPTISFLYLYILWIPINCCQSSSYSFKIKAVYTSLKTLQYIHRFHNTLCAFRPLLYHYHIFTILNPCACYCVCVSVPMFLLLHSPRCSIRCSFNLFFKIILLLASVT